MLPPTIEGTRRIYGRKKQLKLHVSTSDIRLQCFARVSGLEKVTTITCIQLRYCWEKWIDKRKKYTPQQSTTYYITISTCFDYT